MALTANRTMRGVEIREPEPRPGDLKLRVAYCGICGSDVHFYENANPSPEAPLVMGHEFTGEVTGWGEGVEGFSLGEQVVVNPSQSCGECEVCRSGNEELCPRRYEALGFVRQGAYAEYICVRAWTATKLERDAPLDKAALTEPLGVCLQAVELGNVQPGDTVLITGAGPIGLLTCLAAKRAGAGRVIVSEKAEGRREMARRAGAEVLDPADGPLPMRLVDMNTLTGGADIAFECAGVSAAMDDCLGSIVRSGRVVVLSLFGEPYNINLMRLMLSQQQIMGSYGYMESFPEAARMITTGEIDVGPVITDRIGLADAPDAFHQLSTDPGAHCKVLVSPDL